MVAEYEKLNENDDKNKMMVKYDKYMTQNGTINSFDKNEFVTIAKCDVRFSNLHANMDKAYTARFQKVL